MRHPYRSQTYSPIRIHQTAQCSNMTYCIIFLLITQCTQYKCTIKQLNTCIFRAYLMHFAWNIQGEKYETKNTSELIMCVTIQISKRSQTTRKDLCSVLLDKSTQTWSWTYSNKALGFATLYCISPLTMPLMLHIYNFHISVTMVLYKLHSTYSIYKQPQETN